MQTEVKNAEHNSPKKRFHSWLFLRSLLIFERGIFWLLYAIISVMENDDVFDNEESKPRSPNSPGRSHREVKTPTNSDHHKDRTRAVSVPQMPPPKQHSPSGFNPVKDFISNFVNRKGPKKRANIKRSVTTENVTDEKAPVRHIGRGHAFISCHLRNPTWCDCCGEFIWGLFKQCVRCKSELKVHYFTLPFVSVASGCTCWRRQWLRVCFATFILNYYWILTSVNWIL